jgi:hypothetical protein
MLRTFTIAAELVSSNPSPNRRDSIVSFFQRKEVCAAFQRPPILLEDGIEIENGRDDQIRDVLTAILEENETDDFRPCRFGRALLTVTRGERSRSFGLGRSAELEDLFRCDWNGGEMEFM